MPVERVSCECYAIVRKEYEKMTGVAKSTRFPISLRITETYLHLVGRDRELNSEFAC
jgi:hypothetical protein